MKTNGIIGLVGILLLWLSACTTYRSGKVTYLRVFTQKAKVPILQNDSEVVQSDYVLFAETVSGFPPYTNV